MLNLGSPDEFRGDPYGWLTNQMSHVLLGVLVAWIIGSVVAIAPPWLLVAVAFLGAGAVEVIHLRSGRQRPRQPRSMSPSSPSARRGRRSAGAGSPPS